MMNQLIEFLNYLLVVNDKKEFLLILVNGYRSVWQLGSLNKTKDLDFFTCTEVIFWDYVFSACYLIKHQVNQNFL